MSMRGKGERLAIDKPFADPACSFASLSIAIARAERDADATTALNDVAQYLAAKAEALVSICELGVSPNGQPLILWQSTEGGLEIEEDTILQEWFGRASRNVSLLIPARGASWGGLVSGSLPHAEEGTHVAIFLRAEEPCPGPLIEEAQALADHGAACMRRLRKAKAEMLERRRFDGLYESTRIWLELGADIVWEARSDGILRCRRIFNRRNDIAGLLEGLDIRELRVGNGGHTLQEHLALQGSVRHMRVFFSGSLLSRLPSGETIYVSAMETEEKAGAGSASFVGAFTVIGQEAAGHYARETAAMLVQMRDARMREEQQRREAETMLQGLRLLLGADSSREKMERLITLVCECIGSNEARVVEKSVDGSLRVLVPDQYRLGGGGDLALDVLMRHAPTGIARTYEAEGAEGQALSRTLKLEGRHIAVLSLPLRGEAAFLVCTTGRADGFSPSDLDFADRLTLLLRQALLLRDEQSQLAQTAKMAALGQMSASIAHELRQPLNTISLAVQNLEYLLETPGFDAEMATTKIQRVLTQVERASNVIDRMRRFGRKSMGEHVTMSVYHVVENVEAIMHHVLLRGGVSLETDIAEDAEVHADQLQLEQVIGNLLQNAVDAISGIGAEHGNGGGRIRIVAHVMPEKPDRTIIRVEDNGPGFREEIMARVLEPFFTTKSADHGTGLGLAICDTIIRESGGRLEIGNHENGGYVAIILPRESRLS